jgi:hypothetical protein
MPTKKNNKIGLISMLIVVLSVIIITFLAYPRTSSRDDGVLGMSLPATGVWNGFNRHLIVLECSNLKNAGVTLGLTVKNQSNAVIGSEDFSLSGYQSAHIILNKYDINDAYGTFELDLQSGLNPAVSCQTITYRMDSDSRVQYATASKIGELLQGNSSGVFNSMNPDQTISNPVYNWLSIYNPGSDDFSALIRVRDQSGAPLPGRDIRVEGVPSGARQDFALGHPDGQMVGVYEIIPDNDLASYGAFLSRYSETAPGVFSFSMIIPASQGVTDTGMVPASTMGPAFNWAELANISNQTVSAELEVFDRSGSLLYKTEKTLQGYAQYHEFLNRHIGELNVGFFRVKSSAPLVVQSFYYGRDEAQSDRIFWAYNTIGSGEFYRDVSFAVNTNLNAPNWLKIFSVSESGSAEVRVALTLFDDRGEEISLGDNKYSTVIGSADIPIHEFAGSDFLGTLHVNTQTEHASIQAQLVRVFVESGAGGRSSVMRAKSMREISGRSSGGSVIGTVAPVPGQVTSSDGSGTFSSSGGGFGGGSGGGSGSGGWPGGGSDPGGDSGEPGGEEVNAPCNTDPEDCPDTSDIEEHIEEHRVSVRQENGDIVELSIMEAFQSPKFSVRQQARTGLANLIDSLISNNPDCGWKTILDKTLGYLRSGETDAEQEASYREIEDRYRISNCGSDPETSCCTEENPCGCGSDVECRKKEFLDQQKQTVVWSKYVCCNKLSKSCGGSEPCGCLEGFKCVSDEDESSSHKECCPVNTTRCGYDLCGCPDEKPDCRTLEHRFINTCCPENSGPEWGYDYPCGCPDDKPDPRASFFTKDCCPKNSGTKCGFKYLCGCPKELPKCRNSGGGTKTCCPENSVECGVDYPCGCPKDGPDCYTFNDGSRDCVPPPPCDSDDPESECGFQEPLEDPTQSP